MRCCGYQEFIFFFLSSSLLTRYARPYSPTTSQRREVWVVVVVMQLGREVSRRRDLHLPLARKGLWQTAQMNKECSFGFMVVENSFDRT